MLSKFWHQTLKRPYKLYKSVDYGSGKTVLLIHGLGTNGTTWEPVYRLADKQKWHLIGYDLLGFGNSPKPETSTYDVAEHAKSVIASLDRKTKQSKLIIVGHSMGCLVASHIAHTRPDLVEHVILYEPPLFADSAEFRSHIRRRSLYFAFYEQLLMRPQILLAYSKLVARFAEGRALDVNQQSWLPFQRSLQNTIMKQQAYNELKKISVPTDIIYGKFDFVVTRKKVKDMLKANPNVQFHLVNEMHDVTDRAAKYILRLLDQLY